MHMRRQSIVTKIESTQFNHYRSAEVSKMIIPGLRRQTGLDWTVKYQACGLEKDDVLIGSSIYNRGFVNEGRNFRERQSF